VSDVREQFRFGQDIIDHIGSIVVGEAHEDARIGVMGKTI
jgi:hypothetical protein